MVLHRRLSAGGNKFGIFGHDGGLGAGGKQSPCQRDGKQPDNVPHRGGRDQGRADTNTLRFSLDTRNSGTVDGHVATPTRAPKPNSSQPQGRYPIRAEPWPEETSTMRFHSGVIIAPQPAEQRADARCRVARMQPTGRREAPPDDRLREIRGRPPVRIAIPNCAELHPGYESSSRSGGSNQFVSDRPPSTTIAAPVT